MPERFVKAVLTDPTHKLPFPGQSRLFSVSGETIDRWDPFWIMCIKDGSINVVPPAPPAPKPASSAAA